MDHLMICWFLHSYWGIWMTIFSRSNYLASTYWLSLTYQSSFLRSQVRFASKKRRRQRNILEKMDRREQPVWTRPQGSEAPQLHLYNSLSRRKEPFVPQAGRRVLWYSCGPTVYDASHMGHARSYISFDILRRVMTDYFGYDVTYVMNVTDVDDKIIRRARHQHLLRQYAADTTDLRRMVDDCALALQKYSKKAAAEKDADKRDMQRRLVDRLSAAIDKVEAMVKEGGDANLSQAKQLLLKEASDPLAEWLDDRLGHTVTDNVIFADLPRHWEAEFHSDMAALNVLPANVVTRVSEYVPEIVDYIAKIIENGLAYESHGSVYFDVGRFDADDRHHYAKLVPEAYGDSAALQEGEGDLSVSEDRLKEKRSPNDFALWKCSKAGEPSWPSPWGAGRPGWHIECSVMASAICGPSMDIHTGGCDLKFPHHDNELAQAEAYFNNDNWVRYFLHSGHLTIAGCKMSKSLKNFVTIKDALQRHTARQLRLMFLMHAWKDTLDYSEHTMDVAKNFERTVNEFFLYVRSVLRSAPAGVEFFQKWGSRELTLNGTLSETRAGVHAALCDNVDTRASLDALRELVSACNSYIGEARADGRVPNRQLLADAAQYVTHVLRVFGAVPAGGPAIGFPAEGDAGSADLETLVMPYLDVLGRFRERVRQTARQHQVPSVLLECDRVRDEDLTELGVRLEDGGGETVFKLVGRETLLREREERTRQEQQRRLEQERRQLEKLRLEEEREAQRRVPPQQMFRADDKFSRFDEKGMPTHDKDGKEISKGQLKKLLKLYQAQQKRYDEFLASQNKES
ncbi:cysteine--tRNA ligase, cytoplasmic-like isoform X1 [Pollicipes pollicipes]|uniref:cysteine--tRNA ligase, cytoplasmic-like isoform X1 n=2 Tax=Pollicipes pollicipes TaxID=41117 RepID=UPI001884D9C6|nr:cysteine--tRNA ligase, cytoplasmic-like isoform X1 [Pollicipes pollicipes]